MICVVKLYGTDSKLSAKMDNVNLPFLPSPRSDAIFLARRYQVVGVEFNLDEPRESVVHLRLRKTL